MKVILGGFEVMGWHKNLSEFIRTNRNQSEPIGLILISSDKFG